MRDRIGKIFKSKDGVTFVFALVVFMIAAIISATIVSVAMNNLKRVQSRGSSEQARIAVLNAAQLLGSGDTALNDRLSALTASDVNRTWEVSVSGNTAVGDALDVTITWTGVDEETALWAEIETTDKTYAAEVRLNYDESGWKLKRINKIVN